MDKLRFNNNSKIQEIKANNCIFEFKKKDNVVNTCMCISLF